MQIRSLCIFRRPGRYLPRGPRTGFRIFRGAHQRAKLTLVFPREHATPISGWSKAKSALDTASGVSGWWLHDLRRTSRRGCSAWHASRSHRGGVEPSERKPSVPLLIWRKIGRGTGLPRFSCLRFPMRSKPLHSEGRGHKFESCRARQPTPRHDMAASRHPSRASFSSQFACWQREQAE